MITTFLQRNKLFILVGFAALSVIITIGYVIPMDTMKEKVTQFNIWVESLGYFGPLALVIVDALAIVVCFPFTLGFELAAGFLFGLVPGILIISIAKVSGALIAFAMARTILRSWVERMIATNEKFNAIYGAMKVDSFRLAVLLRLSPFPPSWVNNYALAISPVSFRDFLLATAIASLPTIAVNVYMGSFMGSLTTAVAAPSFVQYALSFLGLIAAVFASRIVINTVKSALNNQGEKENAQNRDLEL